MENTEFNYLDINGQTGIKIVSGIYDGVIVTIDEAFIQEAESVGQAVLSFDYTVIHDGGFLPELLTTIEFKRIIGDILYNILIEHTEGE